MTASTNNRYLICRQRRLPLLTVLHPSKFPTLRQALLAKQGCDRIFLATIQLMEQLPPSHSKSAEFICWRSLAQLRFVSAADFLQYDWQREAKGNDILKSQLSYRLALFLPCAQWMRDFHVPP